VSLPTRSARITKPRLPLIVPPTTLSPTVFSTGIGSPVIIDSSTVVSPSKIAPSVGIFSFALTRNFAPA
jgi:hypothetical protein